VGIASIQKAKALVTRGRQLINDLSKNLKKLPPNQQDDILKDLDAKEKALHFPTKNIPICSKFRTPILFIYNCHTYS
jgi:hypothetical protein